MPVVLSLEDHKHRMFANNRYNSLKNRFIDKHERMGFKEWKVANCTHDYNHSHYFDENNRYYKKTNHYSRWCDGYDGSGKEAI